MILTPAIINPTIELLMNFLSNLASSVMMIVIFGACSREQEFSVRNQPSSSRAPSPAAPSARIFVYRDVRSELIDVFDLNRNSVTQGGQDILRDPENASSEFGGPIDSCGDPGFFCFQSGLHIAVPRTSGPRQWTVDHLSCRASPTEERDVDTVLCRNTITGSAVRFRYSGPRGVLSYIPICEGCWSQEFVLVGDKGLFARDQ
jgi:hypothetical protein